MIKEQGPRIGLFQPRLFYYQQIEVSLIVEKTTVDIRKKGEGKSMGNIVKTEGGMEIFVGFSDIL